MQTACHRIRMAFTLQDAQTCQDNDKDSTKQACLCTTLGHRVSGIPTAAFLLVQTLPKSHLPWQPPLESARSGSGREEDRVRQLVWA